MRKTGRIGVLVSGNGTNLQSMIDAIERKELNAEIAVVISNRPEASALERARKKKIPTAVVTSQEFPDREAFDQKLKALLEEAHVDLVALAGFMRILTASFVRHYQGRLMNIHPSLLPAFPGLHAVRQALNSGAKVTGCTLHFVDEGVDSGPIIGQRVVPIQKTDNEETLTERIHSEEHKLYLKGIQSFFDGKLSPKGKGL
ncbi:MAG: phosphoribosylglycinamide formyltransferase [Deltaproteobacteria bacterium]|nr:phosphoribosylglycinamide formyltransferase [Deltaproteobacteria bacterium]